MRQAQNTRLTPVYHLTRKSNLARELFQSREIMAEHGIALVMWFIARWKLKALCRSDAQGDKRGDRGRRKQPVYLFTLIQ